MDSYDVGDSTIVRAEFRGRDGALADPTTVVLHTRTDDSARWVAFAGPITKVSTGVYEATILLDRPGTWRVLATGSGAIAAVERIAFHVRGA